MTLQEKYNLIKEGKGNKSQFLKEAKRNHSNLISNLTSFDQAVTILKSKSILNENTYYADLKPITTFEPSKKENFEVRFAEFLEEQKKKDDESVKIEEKKPSKHVEEVGSHNFDYSDSKNIDNQIGQEVLNGVYLEVQKNPKITKEEALKEVMKNLAKDKLYYVKEGQFGIEGLGYEEQKSEEASGNYKASGYSDKLKAIVKEGLSTLGHLNNGGNLGGVVTTGNSNSIASKSNEIIMQMMTEMEDKIMGLDKDYDYDEGEISRTDREVEFDIPMNDDYAEELSDDMPKDEHGETMEEETSAEEGLGDELAVGAMDEEAIVDDKPAIPKKRNPKMTLQKRMAEIDKLGTALALEAKMEAIDEEISERQDQLTMLDENEAMKKLMDPKKMKELQKEIKLLEKKRGQYEKMHAKASKDAKKKDE